MNKQVKNYVYNKIRQLERERQALAVMQESYNRSVKRTLEMLICAYGLDKKCMIDNILVLSTTRNVIGKLEVIKNGDYNKNNELLPYIVCFKAESSVREVNGKYEWSYPYLENSERKAFTIIGDTPMWIGEGFGCSKVVKSDILEYFKKYVLSRVTAFKEEQA